jgi:hypothetical protein
MVRFASSAGHQSPQEANFDDFRSRQYLAEMGRCLQIDPIRFAAADEGNGRLLSLQRVSPISNR